jgi:hypothetical protein
VLSDGDAGGNQRGADVGLLGEGSDHCYQLGPLQEGELAVAEVIGQRAERLRAQRHRRGQGPGLVEHQ